MIDETSIAAVVDVLKSGMLVQGDRVEQFERSFASYIGTKYAVAVNSGTAALHAALLALGISSGDEVITTPFSFIASANSILFCGAKPVFVDIDERAFNIDTRLIEEKITPRTKAILVVHLYGQPCDMKEITKLCNEHNLMLVEDACQAHGAEYGGIRVGSFGTGCFSFYATKNITTIEGGMITTNDLVIAQRARMIRSHGQTERYYHEIIGYNYRMNEVSAALGICVLERLDENNALRSQNASILSSRIGEIKGLTIPFVMAGIKHVFHQFTIRVAREFGITRNELQQKLIEKGIGSAIHYPIPIHKQKVYQNLGYSDHLPVSEKAAEEVLSLPVHPQLTLDELEYMAQSLRDISKVNI
ncbi:DegT/DnrJ/EryC1/StrS family aminotransferase [Chloroflexota bacterium]